MVDKAALLAALADASPAFMYIKDADGRFIYINRSAHASLNLSEQDYLGKTLYDLVSVEVADQLTRADDEVRSTGKPAFFREEFETPGGSCTIVDLKFPVSIPGYPGAVGGVTIEISETAES